jgi:hypothetical protein
MPDCCKNEEIGYKRLANTTRPLLSRHRGALAPALEPKSGETKTLDRHAVRMAQLRLLSSEKVIGSFVLRPAAAWNAVQSLVEDPQIEALDQAPAALPQAHGGERVAFDRGFRSFPKPNLRTLEPVS